MHARRSPPFLHAARSALARGRLRAGDALSASRSALRDWSARKVAARRAQKQRLADEPPRAERASGQGRREFPLGALLGLVIFAALSPLVAVGVIWLDRQANSTRDAELQAVSDVAKSLSHSVARELRDSVRRGELLGSNPSLAAGDYAAFERVLRSARSKAEADFTLIDSSLRQLINTAAPAGAQQTPPLEIDEARIVFASGEAVVTNMHPSPETGRLQFGVRTPVVIDGDVKYVLTVLPRENSLLRVVDQSYLPPGWNAVIIDGQGRIAARSFQNADFFGRSASDDVLAKTAFARSGAFEATDIDGRRAIAAFNAVDDTNWRVLAWVPVETLGAPRRQAERLAMAGAALAVLLAAVTAFALSRVIRTPTGNLVAAAQALGAGKRPAFDRTFMREANTIGGALVRAGEEISSRERHIRLVMRELSHRSKNLLSIIQAMARQSGQAAVDYPTFARMFDARLAALSRSQDLLVLRDWSGGDMGELIRGQAEPFLRDGVKQLSVEGPALFLNPVAVQNIGMAIHELATNASKYGALSTALGRVDVQWNVYLTGGGEARVRMLWRESGGPEAQPPRRRGFGRIVIEKVVPAALAGQAHLSWALEGFEWQLDVPETALAGGLPRVAPTPHLS